MQWPLITRGALRTAFLVFAVTLAAQAPKPAPFQIEEATIAQIHAAMKVKQLTCVQLVDAYLTRIEKYDKQGPSINAITVVNPNARAEAEARIRAEADAKIKAVQEAAARAAAEARTAAEVLYRGLLDGLGLVSNRDGMAAIGEALPINLLETAVFADGPGAAEALLLGAGGFLPLTPNDQRLAEISPTRAREFESTWARSTSAWSILPLAPSIWSLDRVRPANHPVRRLASLASLVAGCAGDGLLATFFALADSAPSTWTSWLASVKPAIGETRIRQINTNAFGPFLAAYADATDEQPLAERAGAIWELLPGRAEDAIARSTLRQIVGDARLPVRTALEEQGLHQIGRHGCAQLRCFECPIAELAVRHEIAQPPSGDGVSLERL
jgi:hypothetical protein